MTAVGQIIRTNEVEIVTIPLSGGRTIELHNITYASDLNSNPIFLRQLRKSGITYHNKSTKIMLKKEGIIITHRKRERNLFFLDLVMARVAMAVKSLKPRAMTISGCRRPTHLVSKNEHI